MDKVYFHAFRQYAGKWRVPNPGSSKQVVPVTGFVLFLTSLARTASFQTPEENINFKQFQHGSAKNPGDHHHGQNPGDPVLRRKLEGCRSWVAQGGSATQPRGYVGEALQVV